MQFIIKTLLTKKKRCLMNSPQTIADLFSLPIELVDLLLEHGSIQKVNSGDLLGEKGSDPKRLALILDGVFAVDNVDYDGVNRLVGLLGPGSSIFENPIIMSYKVSTVVESLTQSTVLLIPIAFAKQLLNTNLEFNQFLLRQQASKTLYFAQILYWSHEKEMDRKIHLMLTLLSDTVRSRSLPLSNEQLASILGMSRNSVSKALKTLESSGAIRLDKGMISLQKEMREPLK